jgi:hypothetical protein
METSRKTWRGIAAVAGEASTPGSRNAPAGPAPRLPSGKPDFNGMVRGVREFACVARFRVVLRSTWPMKEPTWRGAIRWTLPPFVPSRVVSQRRFFEEGTHPGRRKRLHLWQRSGENLQRYTEIVLPGAHAFWYSGRSASKLEIETSNEAAQHIAAAGERSRETRLCEARR